MTDVRFRRETIEIAVRLAFVTFATGVIYSLTTWDQPGRAVLLALLAALMAVTVAMLYLPGDRLVRSPRRQAVFGGWSLLWVAVVAALAAADGGAASPLALLFFLPILFAALSYSLPWVVVISTASELAFVGIGVVFGGADPEQLAFFAACLAIAAVLCALQAQNHDRRRAEITLTSRADPLTGCLNRRGFEERLAAEIDQGVRSGRPLAVVMIDLDGFKAVNDSRGHAAGDELLCWTVTTIQEAARPMDSVGRLGGDEFAVLLPGAGHTDGVRAAERLQALLSPRVTAASGVAAFPAHGIDRDELLQHADAELYAMKRGRSRESAPGRRELSWAAALARAVDIRTSGSEDHSSRVADYAAGIGVELGSSSSDLGLLRMAAMLHDVGKVGIPDRILRKPSPLSPAEYQEMKKHPVNGAKLLGRVDGLDPILAWIRHSHEHFDGSGYPAGLSGEAIPLPARILLVADAYDALTSTRPYRAAVPKEEALAELRRCAGEQFDPACVAALEAHLSGASTTAERPPAAAARSVQATRGAAQGPSATGR